MKESGVSPLFSVVIPCYNEALTIGRMITETIAVCDAYSKKHKGVYEIIIVDDGSTDASAACIAHACKGSAQAQGIYNAHNAGKGAVIMQGLQRASGQYKMFIDGDLEISPHYIVPFIDAVRTDLADVVIGSKYCAASVVSVSWKRKLFSRVYRFVNRALFGLALEDTQMGIKAFRSNVIDVVAPEMQTRGYAFDIELLVRSLRQGFTIHEVPVDIAINAENSRITRSAIMRMIRDTLSTYRSFFYRDCRALVALEAVRLRPFSARHFAVYPVALVGGWGIRILLGVVGIVMICCAYYHKTKK